MYYGWVRIISDYSKVHIDMICIALSAVPYGAVVCINEFTADHLTSYLIRTLLQPSVCLGLNHGTPGDCCIISNAH